MPAPAAAAAAAAAVVRACPDAVARLLPPRGSGGHRRISHAIRCPLNQVSGLLDAVRENVASRSARDAPSLGASRTPGNHRVAACAGIANVRASVAEWWDGFRAGMDPWLKFVSGAAVLFACSVALDLVEGGWKHMPDVLRLNKSSAGGLRRLESSRVVRSPDHWTSGPAACSGM